MSTALAPLAIRSEALDGRDASLLIGALNTELAAMYPEPGANHFRLDAEEVSPANGVFIIGYLESAPVACGAIRRLEAGVAEIKRMYVVPAVRGRGFSRLILAALEQRARQLGFARLVLETGVRQLEALGLYRGAGFDEVPLFGEYLGSALSICMRKDLS